MQKNKLFSLCNIYILLWQVYELQFFVFGELGTLFSRAIILFLTSISIYYTIYAISRYKIPAYIKGLAFFVSILIIYGLIAVFSPYNLDVSGVNYLLSFSSSLLPIFPCYVFTRQEKLTKTSLQWWIWIFFITATLCYFQNDQLKMRFFMELGSEREEITNNTGYLFVSLIPALVLWDKKRILRFVGLIYCMAFILLSMKRGAILCGAIATVFFVIYMFRYAKRSAKFGIVLLTATFIIIGWFFVQNLLESSDYFNDRLQDTIEGNSSGRDDLFSRLINGYRNETSVFNSLFGNGADATIAEYGQHAHNDWLELLINQGALGVLVYLFYWICFYKSTRKARFNDELYSAVSILLIYNFIRSFFSMSYYDMSIYATVCLGYCMGMISEHENQLKCVSNKRLRI